MSGHDNPRPCTLAEAVNCAAERWTIHRNGEYLQDCPGYPVPLAQLDFRPEGEEFGGQLLHESLDPIEHVDNEHHNNGSGQNMQQELLSRVEVGKTT